MANPNIVDATTITGKLTYIQSVPTGSTLLLAGVANKILKINSLIIANIDTAVPPQSADITVLIKDSSTGNTTRSTLAKDIAVPAYATLVVISKDTSIYLDENDAIYISASAASDLSATCSYDEIS